MLTGKLPFTDDSPVAVAIKHIQEAPTPIRELNAKVPQSVADVTMRAMSKNPEDRYASAGDFLKDLRQVLIDPNGELSKGLGVTTNEEMDTTIQMPKIDAETLSQHKKTAASDQGYAKYAKEVDREVEERKLREIDNKRSQREQKKKEQKVTMMAILSAVLVVAILGVAFSALTGGINIFGGGSETLEIPNLMEMELQKAQQEYREQFSIIRRSETQSDKPAGVIIEQSPKAGEHVTKRDDIVIYVVVSAGNEVITIDNYVGQNRDDAHRTLLEAGYQVNIIEKFSDSEEKDKVIAQEPAANATIGKGGFVTLYVSKGSESAQPTTSATATQEPQETSNATETKAPDTSSKPVESNTPSQQNPASQGGTTATGAPGIGD